MSQLVFLLVMCFSAAFANDDHSEIYFDVDLKLKNFKADQTDKAVRAAELIKQVVLSTAFKEKVLNHTYQGKKTFVDNRGLTNLQIYKRILAGAETLSAEGKNQTMDLEIELYHDPHSSTIGYTYPNISRIYMNTKYFNRYLPYQVTDNMFHEWLHKIGFDHDTTRTPERSYSVPYAVGYIMKALAKKIP